MAKAKQTESEQVTEHISKLPDNFQAPVQYLRQLILHIDPLISEQVKWNAPAFYYNGPMKDFNPKEYKRDILVMNLRKERILIVLPTGAILQNKSGLLEGEYTDGRRLIQFNNLADIQSKEKDFIEIIQEWLSLVEK